MPGLEFGHLQKVTSGDFAPKGLVPEGRCDRSLARSAWKSVPRKNRPVGYGMIGAANPEVFLVEMGAVFLKEG